MQDVCSLKIPAGELIINRMRETRAGDFSLDGP